VARGSSTPSFAAAVCGAACLLVAACGVGLAIRGARPVLSANPSFNDKAAFLRRALAGGCDVLIEGSSVARGGIDGVGLSAALGRRVVNTGYNGASASESLPVYRAIRARCRPGVLVLPMQYIDFQAGSNADNDWPGYARFVSGQSGARLIALYLRRWPLTLGGTLTRDLPVDASGSDMLPCVNTVPKVPRWRDYLNDPVEELTAKDEVAIAELVRTAVSDGAAVYAIRLPMQLDAERTLATGTSDRVWRAIAQAVAGAGGHWIALDNRGAFPDEDFSDFMHLNACGAWKVTRTLTDAVRSAS